MHHSSGAFPVEYLFLVPALAAAAAYVAGAGSNRAGGWPVHRTAVFLLGLVLALMSVLGPLPALAHTDFTWLALSHVAAGMLAPLLLVLSRPVTLALRVMDKMPARRTVRLLRSTPARFLSHPLTAAVLNAGGMFLMFRTPVFEAMSMLAPVHWLMTFHLVAAGYLWTAALIGRDPNPHRTGLRLRAAVLIATAAAHNILAKSLYARSAGGSSRCCRRIRCHGDVLRGRGRGDCRNAHSLSAVVPQVSAGPVLPRAVPPQVLSLHRAGKGPVPRWAERAFGSGKRETDQQHSAVREWAPE